MFLPRRSLLSATALVAAAPATIPALAQTPAVQAGDPRLGERGIGNAEAPVKVTEFFSLTCSHCAAFHKETFPRVKKELVDAGAIRLAWRDFPLDQLALAAACVARSLPAERYEGFISALLTNQDRWAFTRGDTMEELAKMAALAGMTRPKFDEVKADEGLKRAILEQRMGAEREYAVTATPSFSFQAMGKGAPRNQSGNMPFERFQQLVEDARRG